MKNLLPLIILLLIFNTSNAQKGITRIHFKNGESQRGIGKLKGAEYILFKTDKKYPYQLISFHDLKKADMILNDIPISYKIFPIKKKNGKLKDSSVIGLFEKGKVNLYVKGEVKNVTYFNSGISGTGFNSIETTSATVHYFLKKENDEVAVHIGSSYYPIETLLKNTEDIFSECPDLIKKIIADNSQDKSIFEIIATYNNGCSK